MWVTWRIFKKPLIIYWSYSDRNLHHFFCLINFRTWLASSKNSFIYKGKFWASFTFFPPSFFCCDYPKNTLKVYLINMKKNCLHNLVSVLNFMQIQIKRKQHWKCRKFLLQIFWSRNLTTILKHKFIMTMRLWLQESQYLMSWSQVTLTRKVMPFEVQERK